MKRYLEAGSVVALALSLMLMIGCNRQNETAPQPEAQVEAAAAVDAAVGADYPLDVCVISGNKLDSMGGPVTLEHEGQQVQICCAPCEGTFRADPAKYLEMVAQARQGATQ